MTHSERQKLIRRKFALECFVGSLSLERLSAASAASLAASYNLPEPDARRILDSETSRRRK